MLKSTVGLLRDGIGSLQATLLSMLVHPAASWLRVADDTVVSIAHAYVCRKEDIEDDASSVYEVRVCAAMLFAAALLSLLVAAMWLCCHTTLAEVYLHPDRFDISAERVAPSLVTRQLLSPSRRLATGGNEHKSPAARPGIAPAYSLSEGVTYRVSKADDGATVDGLIDGAMHLHPLVASASQADVENTIAAEFASSAAPHSIRKLSSDREPSSYLCCTAASGERRRRSYSGRFTPSLEGNTRYNASSLFGALGPRESRSSSAATSLPAPDDEPLGAVSDVSNGEISGSVTAPSACPSPLCAQDDGAGERQSESSMPTLPVHNHLHEQREPSNRKDEEGATVQGHLAASVNTATRQILSLLRVTSSEQPAVPIHGAHSVELGLTSGDGDDLRRPALPPHMLFAARELSSRSPSSAGASAVGAARCLADGDIEISAPSAESALSPTLGFPDAYTIRRRESGEIGLGGPLH